MQGRKAQVVLLMIALGGLWCLGSGAGKLLGLWAQDALTGAETPAAALTAAQRCQRGVPADVARRCVEALRQEQAQARWQALAMMGLGLAGLAPPLLALRARRRRLRGRAG